MKGDDEIQIVEPPPGTAQRSATVPKVPTTRAGRSPASSADADTPVTRAREPIELDDDGDIVMLSDPPTRQLTASAQRPTIHDIRVVEDIPDIVEFCDESGVLPSAAPRTAATTSAQSPHNVCTVMETVQPSATAPATAGASTAFQAYQSPLGRRMPAERPPAPQVLTRSTTTASPSRASTTEPAIAGLLDAPFADMFIDIEAQAARLRASPPASVRLRPMLAPSSDIAAPSPLPAGSAADEAEALSVEVKLERRDSTEDLRTPTRGSTATGRKPRVPLLLHVEMERLADQGGVRNEWDEALDALSRKGTDKSGEPEVRLRKASGKQVKKLGPKAKAKRRYFTVGICVAKPVVEE